MQSKEDNNNMVTRILFWTGDPVSKGRKLPTTNAWKQRWGVSLGFPMYRSTKIKYKITITMDMTNA
jgi:hypothetical protein